MTMTNQMGGQAVAPSLGGADVVVVAGGEGRAGVEGRGVGGVEEGAGAGVEVGGQRRRSLPRMVARVMPPIPKWRSCTHVVLRLVPM